MMPDECRAETYGEALRVLSMEKLEDLRNRVNALNVRRTREIANRNGSWYGVSWKPYRWTIFLHRIRMAARVGVRFAEHEALVGIAMNRPEKWDVLTFVRKQKGRAA